MSVELRDRGTGRLVLESADVLVGADGIHSAVRVQLHPDEGPPIWNGIQLWRGLTEAEPFLGGRTMILSGAGPLVVVYPVSRAAEQRGRSALNWGVGVRLRQPTQAPLGDWHYLGGSDDVLPHVADRHIDRLDVPALVRAAPTIWEYPMVDRNPLPHWGTGRVSLLGDAAHPMYPFFARIEDVMTSEELDSIAMQYRKTAGFDAETLNAAPSWDVTTRASPVSSQL